MRTRVANLFLCAVWAFALQVKASEGPNTGQATVREIDRHFMWHAPRGLDAAKPAPVLIALHRHGRQNLSSAGTTDWGKALPPADKALGLVEPGHKIIDLDRIAKKFCTPVIDAWKELADARGFIVVAPLGDPDVLVTGIDWLYGDHHAHFQAILDAVAEHRALDRKRVYLYGEGMGGHVVVATGLSSGKSYAGVAAVNPALFLGERGIPNGPQRTLILPETLDGLLPEQVGKGTRFRVMIGTDNARTVLGLHCVSICKDRVRYVDYKTDLPASHFDPVRDFFEKKGIPVVWEKIPGGHRDPLPAERYPALWKWLFDETAESGRPD